MARKNRRQYDPKKRTKPYRSNDYDLQKSIKLGEQIGYNKIYKFIKDKVGVNLPFDIVQSTLDLLEQEMEFNNGE